MPSLKGARIGLLESRLSQELAELVRRLGGTPVIAPSVREVPHQEETTRFVQELLTKRFSVIVVLTGAAASAVLREAERGGQLREALDAFEQATLVCRGPKPTAVMRRNGVQVDIIPEKPFTTKELLHAIEGVDLAGRDVALLHYGERNTAL